MDKKKSAPTTNPENKEDLPAKKRSSGKSKSGRGGLRTAPAKESDQDRQSGNKSFPVVGVGASAGGLEAFTELLGALPADTGMAFVLIQHLDPRHESILTGLLSRATNAPVIEVKDGMRIEPDYIYVIPPNTTMGISQGVLSLILRPKTSTPHMPIDHFLRSLAEDQGSKSVGVILSGTGSDGAIGIEAIKAEGGITFAQDEKSAKYSGMPHSAVATGCVDLILPPEEIAKELAKIKDHPYVAHPESVETDKLISKDNNGLNKIFILMRAATGVDFTHYKQATVKRRIMRRMALHKIEELEDYVNYLKDNPSELEALYQDMLIKVTRFFRDPESFEILKNRIFPSIVKNKSPEDPVRIWVPGCSTGEEAYSIAISLLEFLGNTAANVPIQIFATDISETVINKARAGVYIENVAADISPERLRRFFTKADRGYQITKTIRDMCVFAKQNLVRDPPFSNLDLISCCNVLIYLGPVLQKRVIPIFHYALMPSGFLMLGQSETIGDFSEMFAPLDKRHKIYSKKATSARPTFNFASDYSAGKKPIDKNRSEEARSEPDIYKEADHIILSEYAPASVIINDDMEILQFRGHTGPYLDPASGKASLNLLKMAQEGLLLDLRTAIQRAKKGEKRVREEGLRIKFNGESRDLDIEVIPMKVSSSERFFLVLFKEVAQSSIPELDKTKTKKAQPGELKKEAENREIAKLKHELDATKEYLQSSVQEQEASNEELKSANEEIMSSNEELESINEELETAKEELQSANEELNTVNEELQNRNTELGQLNNDLGNLLSSVNIPIVMLGNDLRIRRFTPMTEKALNLITTDVGRPISDINLNIAITDLERLILDAIDTVTVKEQEVQDRSGRWYYMQIRPYKTMENKIDGAVMVLVDIDERKRAEETLRESYAQLSKKNRNETIISAVTQSVHQSIALQDVLENAVEAISKIDGVDNVFISLVEGKEAHLMAYRGYPDWFIERMRRIPYPKGATWKTMIEGKPIYCADVDKDTVIGPAGREAGTKSYLSMPIRLRDKTVGVINISSLRKNAFEEELKLLEIVAQQIETAINNAQIAETLRQSENQIKASLKEKETLINEIQHRVKNNLQIISSLLTLQSEYVKDERFIELFNETQNRVRSMALIHEILYQSEDLSRIDFGEYIQNLTTHLFQTYGVKSDDIRLDINAYDISLGVDTAVPCGLIINELVSNSLKHAFPVTKKGQIRIVLSSDGGNKFTLIVSDDGIGFPKDLDFRNPESLGLQLVVSLVNQLGGAIRLSRRHGTEFKIVFGK